MRHKHRPPRLPIPRAAPRYKTPAPPMRRCPCPHPRPIRRMRPQPPHHRRNLRRNRTRPQAGLFWCAIRAAIPIARRRQLPQPLPRDPPTRDQRKAPSRGPASSRKMTPSPSSEQKHPKALFKAPDCQAFPFISPLIRAISGFWKYRLPPTITHASCCAAMRSMTGSRFTGLSCNRPA
jgi:hypothetical protein